MDPNATLAEIRRLVRDAEHWAEAEEHERKAEAFERLAELAGALDGWLTSGGFLPSAWQQGRASWVASYLAGATRAEVSGPFQTRASAERFAAGLASSGRTTRVEILGHEPERA